ncbi:hypothetical protein HY339_02770 [Candidatus Gottesmanbacteria bacterium]|nr:hypothetical protein [Candidatus Gottesmanbacteria bacterium]
MTTLADAKNQLLDVFRTGMTEEEFVQAEALLEFRLGKLESEAGQVAYCEGAVAALSTFYEKRVMFSIGDADPSVLREVPPSQWPGLLAGMEAARRR